MTAIPDDVIAAAQAAHRSTGIPASVSLAQWALESGWGQHEPPGSQNPFGVKAIVGQPFVTSATHEVVDGKTIEVDAKFRAYATLDDAFTSHAEMLAVSPHFAKARASLPDALKFCDGISLPNVPAYATDPDYASKLRSVIASHGLLVYDVASAVVAPVPRSVGAAAVSVAAGGAESGASGLSWLQRWFGWGHE